MANARSTFRSVILMNRRVLKEEYFISTSESNLPDILTVEEVMYSLQIGRSSTYKLLRTNQIQSLRVRNKYLIPQHCLLDFLHASSYNDTSTHNNEACNIVSLETEVVQ